MNSTHEELERLRERNLRLRSALLKIVLLNITFDVAKVIADEAIEGDDKLDI
jgi:hypothetical protein